MNDKGKFILGAPPKVGKKETKQKNNHSTNKKSPPKKPYFCHYCGASGHTRPNCYKWLTTQQSNSVSSLGNQNQLQLSLASLGELLKEFMTLSNFNGFNSSSFSSGQKFMQKKGSSSRLWCGLNQFIFDALFVCCCGCCCCCCFFFFFSFLLREKKKKYKKQCVCVYRYLCTLDGV